MTGDVSQQCTHHSKYSGNQLQLLSIKLATSQGSKANTPEFREQCRACLAACSSSPHELHASYINTHDAAESQLRLRVAEGCGCS